MQIIVNGSSDDLVDIDGCEGGDEFNCSEPGSVKLTGNFIAPDGSSARLIAIYDEKGFYSSGTWSFALGLINEDASWCEWPVNLRPSQLNSYSMELVIDAPEGTVFISDEES